MTPPRSPAWFALKQQVEDFLYMEADLLEQRLFREWLDLLAEDLVYLVPIGRNVKFGRHAEEENTRQGKGISWSEDKRTLGKRAEQILTGVHYVEEPLSRITHMVSNRRLPEVVPSAEDPAQVVAGCRFLVYRNRVEYETNTFVGRASTPCEGTSGSRHRRAVDRRRLRGRATLRRPRLHLAGATRNSRRLCPPSGQPRRTGPPRRV